MMSATTAPPVFTDTVNQSFFIEAQGGSQPPINYLDRFPDTVYSKSIDSNLIRFLYALLGPVGVGQIRQEYLEARLMFEDAGLSVFYLDALYANPFAFARVAEETYEMDASSALLSAMDRARILTADAAYRNRAIDYFKGIRAGGTLRGLTLVAKSGLNMPVELVENYRALWDQYCDTPLGLPYLGRTVDANEVIVLPRQDIPRNAQQTFVITGNPTQGYFTLQIPLGTAPTTDILPYNASAVLIQNGLQALSVIGASNVFVTGGPLPNQPIVITFVNAMGDQPVPPLLPNLAPPTVQPVADSGGDTTGISYTLNIDVAGVSADSQRVTIAPRDEHAMQIALDRIRPQTSFFTTTEAPGVTQRRPIREVFAGSTYVEVLRYETGNARVQWPADSIHWIRKGAEREAPRPMGGTQHHYQGFHNIVNVTAYTEAALLDEGYSNGTTDLIPYWDTLVGRFSPAQVALYPFLGAYNNNVLSFPTLNAVAASPDPLIVTQTIQGQGVINDIYPSDYVGLSGQPQTSPGPFWASMERTLGVNNLPATDYLEIDLGYTQAVNYLYFEATRKPFGIQTAFDQLDQAPARMFFPVTILSADQIPSTTSLGYSASTLNPWEVVEIHFTNGSGRMIYTRYIRLGFQRNPGNTPFAQGSQLLPYSVEVRNLRVGRNI